MINLHICFAVFVALLFRPIIYLYLCVCFAVSVAPPSAPKRSLSVEPLTPRRKRYADYGMDLYQKPPDSPPLFSLYLRPRLIQEGDGVKLIAVVTGKPVPEVRLGLVT